MATHTNTCIKYEDHIFSSLLNTTIFSLIFPPLYICKLYELDSFMFFHTHTQCTFSCPTFSTEMTEAFVEHTYLCVYV